MEREEEGGAMPQHIRPPKVRDSSLKYLEDIALVEEILPDGTRLFPHTGQLPVVGKAVDKEFFEGVPRHVAITDHRADDKRKYTLHDLATSFCYIVNACRKDDLLLLPVYQRNLVTRIAIAQRRDRPESKGTSHSFRFFVEGKPFPDVHLSGKTVAFASHVFERYQERAAKLPKVPLSLFLYLLYASQGIVMRVNHRESALAFPFPADSILAIPFEEHAGHFFFTTCLTTHEIKDLQPSDPLRILDFHHGQALPERLERYFSPDALVEYIMTAWRNRAPASIPADVYKLAGEKSWIFSQKILRKTAGSIFKDNHQLCFHGNFHSYGASFNPPEYPHRPPLDPLPAGAAAPPGQN